MLDAIAYGEKLGDIVHIRDVPRGLACGCRCLNCCSPLIARKGAVRVHHFAHVSGSLCHGLAEGVLHRLAKKILSESESLWVPAYQWSRSRKLRDGTHLTRSEPVTKAGTPRIVKAITEYRSAPGFIPDIHLTVGRGNRTKSLYVEIIVTSPVDRRKLRRIRSNGIPTIAIRLGPEHAMWSPEALRAIIAGPSDATTWLFHPAQVPLELEFIRTCRAANRQWRRAGNVRKLAARSKKHTRSAASRLGTETRSNHDASMREKLRHDEAADAFFRHLGRYPTLEEIRQRERRR